MKHKGAAVCLCILAVFALCLVLMPARSWAKEGPGDAIPSSEIDNGSNHLSESLPNVAANKDTTEDMPDETSQTSNKIDQQAAPSGTDDKKATEQVSEQAVEQESAVVSEETASDAAAEVATEEIATEGGVKAEAQVSAEATGEVAKFLRSKSGLTVAYRTHVQTFGWQGFKTNGASSGTTGLAKRLEAIEIGLKAPGVSGGIRYKVHRQTYGWESDWKYDGATSGTTGQAKRLEAIRIELTGDMASKYDVWYHVHAQKLGWMGWAKNGESAGTAGYAYRLEAIEIKILPKGSNAPGSTSQAFAFPLVQYRTHVQTFGWQDWKRDGGAAGTTGLAKRLEGINISLPAAPVSGGITYCTHVQTYGWMGWVSNGQMSGTTGQAKRLEAIRIKLTGQMANKYDVWYRVHAQKFGWMGWVKNGDAAGTAAYAYRLEAIQIVLVNKNGAMPSTSLGGCKQNTAKGFIQRPDDYLDYSVKREWTIVKERYGYTNGAVDINKNDMSFYDDHHIVKPSVRDGWVDAQYQSWWPSPNGKVILELTYDVRRSEASQADKNKTGCKYMYSRRTANFKLQLRMSGGRLVAIRYVLADKNSIKKSSSPYDRSPCYSNHKFSPDQMRSMFSADGVLDWECQTSADKAYAKTYCDPSQATRGKYIKDIYYIHDNTVYSWAKPHNPGPPGSGGY